MEGQKTMMSITQIAAAVTAVVAIGGTAVGLNELHVPAAEFEQYLEQEQMADEREFVQDLKEDIREINYALREHPGDEYLEAELAAMIDELCELRPKDRLCDDEVIE
jgi:hypothetical protein